jgi:hypothetical protein
VLISIVLAWLTYRLIERPIRAAGLESIKAGALLIMMAIVGCAGLITFVDDGFVLRMTRQGTFADWKELQYSSHWDGWTSCTFVKEDPGLGGCKSLISPSSTDRRIFDVAVIGDSHAGHLAPGLREAVGNRPENLVVMFHAGCYPFYSTETDGEKHFKCAGDLIDNALNYAVRSSTIRTIVLRAILIKFSSPLTIPLR